MAVMMSKKPPTAAACSNIKCMTCLLGVYTVLSSCYIMLLHSAADGGTSQVNNQNLRKLFLSMSSALPPVHRRASASSIPETVASESPSSDSPSNDDQLNTADDEPQAVGCSSTKVDIYANNSQAWLKTSRRYGNTEDGRMARPEYIRDMILNIDKALVPMDPVEDDFETDSSNEGMRRFLRQSVCHEKSRLLNPRLDSTTDPKKLDDKEVRMWAVRLLFMAIHYHQHHWAVPEAKTRLDALLAGGASPSEVACPKSPEAEDYGIGSFDYECPNAKYLVVALGGFGLGVNMRIVASAGLLLGFVTNRVVLFLNNIETVAKARCPKTQSPGCKWALVSCERGDFQCFYMPTSPCTITTEDVLENSYTLTLKETRSLVQHNRMPAGQDDKKVWILTPTLANMGKSHLLTQGAMRLRSYVLRLLSNVPQSDPRLPLLRKASKAIFRTDPLRDGYHYLSATDKVRHAMTMYALRPNLQSADKLNQIKQEIDFTRAEHQKENLPWFSPETSIGLPIRASDKCRTESDCLTFDQHMEVTTSLWEKHVFANAPSSSNTNSTAPLLANPTVIFTTESKQMIAEQAAFSANMTRQAQFPYKFEFLSNTRDVAPDTGFIRDLATKQKLAKKARRNEQKGSNKLQRAEEAANAEHELTADETLLGAMSSLQFQLLPRVSVGNCCSNFHILLNDLLMEGCGAASDNDFLCLNEYEDDPALRVCCGWHHDCKRAKEAYLRQSSQQVDEEEQVQPA